MLKELKLTNLLSFGSETKITFNEGLNVLIGANGSGKSNLIEVISLLQAMPKDLTQVIRGGGGIQEWLWKGEQNPIAKIETVIENTDETLAPFRHTFKFCADGYQIEVINESIEKIYLHAAAASSYPYYKYTRKKNQENKTYQSVLIQRQDPDNYPEIAYISSCFQKIRFYREWQFGRNSILRNPQRADLPNDFLDEDAGNLGLILSSFRRNSEVKRKLLESLKLFYENIEDFEVIVQGGYVQVFFEENGFTIPATRLSDGTLRYLSLLAILLHPEPPTLICIEEPELGLHPDILPTLVDLLKEAAQKTQIIITTHSTDLIDDLTDMPEAVLVFDKEQGSTSVNRLNKEDLKEWLDKYRLGELWSRGHIGGNRW
ncbi:MAG: AAA family ATPase [Methylococcaceae bacterium]|nr:AAA family ATPase [Methylococcaceae bacterium]